MIYDTHAHLDIVSNAMVCREERGVRCTSWRYAIRHATHAPVTANSHSSDLIQYNPLTFRATRQLEENAQKNSIDF